MVIWAGTSYTYMCAPDPEPSTPNPEPTWRGGGVAEGCGVGNRYAERPLGSYPPPSAIRFRLAESQFIPHLTHFRSAPPQRQARPRGRADRRGALNQESGE